MISMRFCATLILSALTASGVRLAAQPTTTFSSSPPPPAPSATSAPVAPGAASPSGAVISSTSGPMIQFESTMFDFGKVSVGEKVRHTYMLTNTGTETLLITNVHPGCHCTTAGDWTHKVEPGK